jgi:hypothetical protein
VSNWHPRVRVEQEAQNEMAVCRASNRDGVSLDQGPFERADEAVAEGSRGAGTLALSVEAAQSRLAEETMTSSTTVVIVGGFRHHQASGPDVALTGECPITAFSLVAGPADSTRWPTRSPAQHWLPAAARLATSRSADLGSAANDSWMRLLRTQGEELLDTGYAPGYEHTVATVWHVPRPACTSPARRPNSCRNCARSSAPNRFRPTCSLATRIVSHRHCPAWPAMRCASTPPLALSSFAASHGLASTG